jgi:hypothetical protein
MTERGHVLKQEPENVRGAFVGKTVTAAVVIGCLAVLVSGILLAAWSGRLAGQSALPHYPVSERVGGIYQTDLAGPPHGLIVQDAELKSLERYHYVDRSRKVAQIPIERAMAWLADDARRSRIRSPDPGSVLDAGAGTPDGE